MAEKNPKTPSKPKALPKPVHATASPYRAPTVDMIGQPHHDILVDSLVNVLTPIKAWRAQVSVSKGRNSKKRKRKSDPTDVKPTEDNPPPQIQQHLLLGFNHVTRHLEELSTFLSPQYSSNAPSTSPNNPPTSANNKQHIAAIFLFHPLDDLIYSHLPTLCHTASLAHAELPATRLILLDPTVEKRIAEAVGLQRVSVLGVLVGVLEGKDDVSAEAEGLVRYVREHVEPVEVPWLREVRQGVWLGTRVESS